MDRRWARRRRPRPTVAGGHQDDGDRARDRTGERTGEPGRPTGISRASSPHAIVAAGRGAKGGQERSVLQGPARLHAAPPGDLRPMGAGFHGAGGLADPGPARRRALPPTDRTAAPGRGTRHGYFLDKAAPPPGPRSRCSTRTRTCSRARHAGSRGGTGHRPGRRDEAVAGRRALRLRSPELRPPLPARTAVEQGEGDPVRRRRPRPGRSAVRRHGPRPRRTAHAAGSGVPAHGQPDGRLRQRRRHGRGAPTDPGGVLRDRGGGHPAGSAANFTAQRSSPPG